MIEPESRSDEGLAIGDVARRYALHPQTLRVYERMGLLEPDRSAGNARRYGEGHLRRLGRILGLVRDEGLNLAAVGRVLELEDRVGELEREVRRLRQAPSGGLGGGGRSAALRARAPRKAENRVLYCRPLCGV